MCGLNFTTTGLIDLMNDAISHRGLPGRAHVTRLNYGDFEMGHVRLPIQGLSEKFDQPFVYDKKVYCFVGEIFNYKELMPNAKSDIEVLTHYWDKEGPNCLPLFDGFWSFLVYDPKNMELFVVSDRLAKKPLYWHKRTNSFSSEMKALIPLTNHERDEMYFSCVGKWGYDASERTPYKEIIKVPAGTVIKVNLITGASRIDHWGEPSAILPKSCFYTMMNTSVKRRLVSDIPVSVLVSGGVDSSIIYHHMHLLTRNFTVYHIDNNEEEFLNELNIPSDIRVVKLPKPYEPNLKETLWHNDGPVDLGSMLPQYAMAKAIKDDGINVVLTGDGADELFGGYRRQFEYDAQYSDIYQELIFYHLPRLDKLSMAHTVELRSPFLADYILNLALSLPYSERINKKFLKDQYRGILPDRILDRPKHPLKSEQVLSGTNWRYHLIKLYERIMYEHGKVLV